MRRLNILTWHTHGSYLYYLSHVTHEFHVLAKPGRPPGYGIRVPAVVAGGMRTPFLLDRFPDLDPALLQDRADVAQAILGALLLPRSSVVPELTVLPLRETSWP